MHNDYTLLWRTYPNGTKVVFYYAYDDNDVRQGPWTTKCRSITVARNYCNRSYQDKQADTKILPGNKARMDEDKVSPDNTAQANSTSAW
jgi:hypothetical protein